eukprot:TRINITY_DN9393_c1_g1_i3.p1 TRINITY_DN9393_c1_g1~~TRINITY_DN9393_c1_g1_i3.p1  ORF type:complete len:108 (-),score=7.88 TRINITY_DN9393_c1_g1_i3:268-591(-)
MIMILIKQKEAERHCNGCNSLKMVTVCHPFPMTWNQISLQKACQIPDCHGYLVFSLAHHPMTGFGTLNFEKQDFQHQRKTLSDSDPASHCLKQQNQGLGFLGDAACC